MAGLLGETFDDPRTMAVLTGAAGLLGGGNFGQALSRGLLGYQGVLANAQEMEMKKREMAQREQFQAAQMANYLSEAKKREEEIALAKQQAARLDAFNQRFNNAGTNALAASAAAGAPGPTIQAGQQATADQLDLISEGARMGYIKNPSTVLDAWKLRQPDIVISDGFAVDRKALQPGQALPQVKTSANGQTTMLQPDGKGGFRVVVPENAVEAFAGFQKAEQDAKSSNELVTVNYPDGTSETMTKAEQLRRLKSQMRPTQSNAAPPSVPTSAPTGFGTQRLMDAIAADAARNGIVSPQINLTNPGAGKQWDWNPMQPGGMRVQSPSEKVAAEVAARLDAERMDENTKKAAQFKNFVGKLDEAEKLLKTGPTGSGLGTAFDNTAGFFGYSPKGAAEAKSLEAIGAWMLQDIPKAPGAQSDAELRDYKIAAGQVGDRMVPINQRLAALGTVRKIVSDWQSRTLGAQQDQGQQEQAPMPKPTKRYNPKTGRLEQVP